MGERRLALFQNIQREKWKTNELQNIGIIEVSPKGSEITDSSEVVSIVRSGMEKFCAKYQFLFNDIPGTNIDKFYKNCYELR